MDVRGSPGVNNGANIQQWTCEDPCSPKTDQVITAQFYLIISRNEVFWGYHNFVHNELIDIIFYVAIEQSKMTKHVKFYDNRISKTSNTAAECGHIINKYE